MADNTVPAWLVGAALAIGAAAPIIAQWVQTNSMRGARREERLAARDAERRADARELQDALSDLVSAWPDVFAPVDAEALFPLRVRVWKWASRVQDDELRRLALEVTSHLTSDEDQNTTDWGDVHLALNLFNARVNAVLAAAE